VSTGVPSGPRSPVAPPGELVNDSVVVSEFFGIGVPSAGSGCSTLIVDVLEKSRSVCTVTAAWPGPSDAAMRLRTDVAMFSSIAFCCSSCSPTIAPPLWPGAESTLPSESATVTSSGVMSATPEDTMLTIACTDSAGSCVPPVGSTSTEAVARSSSLPTNTFSRGMVSMTRAVATPSMYSIVLPSSPCSARW